MGDEKKPGFDNIIFGIMGEGTDEVPQPVAREYTFVDADSVERKKEELEKKIRTLKVEKDHLYDKVEDLKIQLEHAIEVNKKMEEEILFLEKQRSKNSEKLKKAKDVVRAFIGCIELFGDEE